MRLNRDKASGKRIVLNFDFADLKQKHRLEMIKGMLNHTESRQAKISPGV